MKKAKPGSMADLIGRASAPPAVRAVWRDQDVRETRAAAERAERHEQISSNDGRPSVRAGKRRPTQ